jgi:nucleoside-diphosphate-sugar epimerase
MTFPVGAEYLNPSAEGLWARSLDANDRILITGATGWFGQTAVSLCGSLSQQTLLTASRTRDFSIAGVTHSIALWDESLVKDFDPTVVIDCAFLTRDRINPDDVNSYVQINRELNDQLLFCAGLPHVRSVVTISSGAAVFPNDAALGTIEQNPYGFLKREAESALADFARSSGIGAVVARAWSVSGAFVGKPRSYALTDMILQASLGAIHVSARSKVFRRYVAVEELLAVALAEARAPGFRVVDSEGQLVEMQELAELVKDVVNPKAIITREPFNESDDNLYYAQSNVWLELSRANGLELSSLPQQISRALSGLQMSGDVKMPDQEVSR